MDFAKKLLKKYGWNEGEGLGKNNDGISKPLRAHMKFDNTGLGNERATEFNNHWWERCYNEASENLNVDVKDDGKVQMSVKDSENGVEITTKSYSVNKLKKVKDKSDDNNSNYDNFLFASTLTNTGEVQNNSKKIALDDIALRSVKILSDDELFKACGQLTAHKGARHGLKLSGKLSRLNKQEEEILSKMKQGVKPFVDDSQDVVTKKKHKKNKRKHREEQETNAECVVNEENANVTAEEEISSKKKKKKEKAQKDCLESAEGKEEAKPELCNVSSITGKIKTKGEMKDLGNIAESIEEVPKKKKKKSKATS